MRDNRLLDSRSQLHFHLVAFVGETGLHAGAHGGGVCIREPGIQLCLDSRSQLHFHLVAFVGETGLHAGTNGGRCLHQGSQASRFVLGPPQSAALLPL